MQQYHPDFHRTTTEGFIEHIGTEGLDKTHKAGMEIVNICREALGTTNNGAEDGTTLINLANRVRGGETGHIDVGSYLTVWHGATHSGLRIYRPSGSIEIPGVPAGYCLVWRGTLFAGEKAATRHCVKYSSSQPRTSLVSF